MKIRPSKTSHLAEWLSVGIMMLTLLLPAMQERAICYWDIGLLFGSAAAVVSLLPLMIHFIFGGETALREYLDYFRAKNGIRWQRHILFCELPLLVIGVYSGIKLFSV